MKFWFAGVPKADTPSTYQADADTCCIPGYEPITLKNLCADRPSFVFIADDAPLQKKLGVYEVRN